MNSLSVPLKTTPEQTARLRALQQAFAEVCNTLAPVARDTRCWNRVALHHMTYRSLRERFPQIGSQMVCNAIYSVSRACRLVYQSAESPFNIVKAGHGPLPLLRFTPNAPVYFDRHTLSVKDGRLSMYTLDGRIRFQVALSPVDEKRFHEQKLHEIVLAYRQDVFSLTFAFGDDPATPEGGSASEDAKSLETGTLPEHLMVLSEPEHTRAGDPA